jgi:hypothetical protein
MAQIIEIPEPQCGLHFPRHAEVPNLPAAAALPAKPTKAPLRRARANKTGCDSRQSMIQILFPNNEYSGGFGLFCQGKKCSPEKSCGRLRQRVQRRDPALGATHANRTGDAGGKTRPTLPASSLWKVKTERR